MLIQISFLDGGIKVISHKQSKYSQVGGVRQRVSPCSCPGEGRHTCAWLACRCACLLDNTRAYSLIQQDTPNNKKKIALAAWISFSAFLQHKKSVILSTYS